MKESQNYINERAVNAYYTAKDELYNEYWREPEKLRYCNARVYKVKHFYLLESYQTIVAVIDRRNNRGTDVLRYVYGYTATSAQHIRKFFADYGAETVDTYRP